MNKDKKIEVDYTKIYLLIIFGILISVLVSGTVNKLEDNSEFNPSKLSENEGYQLCTASINSKALICKDKNIMVETFNQTIENLNSFIKGCPNAVIQNYKKCIGDRIVYENGEFTK